MNKKCIIFLSKKENYYGSAVKIKENTFMKTDIFYIEDFIIENNQIEKTNNSIIYFLCNSVLINDVLNILENANCYIINKNFFINNYTKLEIQKILLANHLNIPELFETNIYDKLNYPIFCKENKHAGIIFKAYTSNTLNKFFQKFDRKDFYIEEAIEDQKVLKYYYVKQRLFCMDNYIPVEITNYCERISKSLDLDVFSFDVMKRKNDYVIIDVNPSAGFYLLDEARNKLINEIEELGKKE